MTLLLRRIHDCADEEKRIRRLVSDKEDKGPVQHHVERLLTYMNSPIDDTSDGLSVGTNPVLGDGKIHDLSDPGQAGFRYPEYRLQLLKRFFNPGGLDYGRQIPS